MHVDQVGKHQQSYHFLPPRGSACTPLYYIVTCFESDEPNFMLVLVLPCFFLAHFGLQYGSYSTHSFMCPRLKNVSESTLSHLPPFQSLNNHNRHITFSI